MVFKSTMIELDGPVHVADFGGHGKPVVCVHGLGGSHLNWMSAGPLLAQHHRVLAVDLIGHGRTPPAGRSATIESNQQFLDRFLRQHVGERATILGNSMGGLITMLQAESSPDSVESIVLVNPALPPPIMLPSNPQVLAMFGALSCPGMGELLMWMRNLLRGAEHRVHEMLELACADARMIKEEVRRAHVEFARMYPDRAWGDRAMLEATRSLVRMLLSRGRFQRMVRNIRTPALLLAGAHDRLVPLAAAEHVANLRADWHFAPLDHVGHVPMLEDPEGFTALVCRWIEGVDKTREVPALGSV